MICDPLVKITIKCLNFVFKVYLSEPSLRLYSIFRDYNEVFNLRIHPYVHGKCSYYMKIIISRGRNSGRRWTIVQHSRECSIKKKQPNKITRPQGWV